MKKSYLTVTDQFCGAGGSSIGAVEAGAELQQAMNHWKRAVETYSANHPNTDVDCTDISACDPRRYPSTDILITSPECTNHSLAKGKQRKYQAQMEMFGKAIIDPAEERSRATMWDTPRFAEIHDYRLIITENVVDARNWRLFNAWLQAMSSLDYNHEIVYFNSMFAHPTPQSRDRMYVVFWKRGNKAPDLRFTPPAYCPRCECNVAAVQGWKNPGKRWGRYGKNRQYLYHCPTCAGEVTPYYYCAANAIDWALPSERIGDRKRPLKEKTLDRIRVGLEKYGRQPFLTSYYTRAVGRAANSPIDAPLPTQPTWPVHYLVDLGHTHAEHPGKCHNMYEPIPTQTSRQTLAFVVSMRDSPDYPLKHITESLPTQSTVGAPYLVELYGQSSARPITDPMGSILTTTHHGLVQPYLVEMHGSGTQARPLTDVLGCVLAGGNHHGLVTPSPFLTSVNYFDEITRPVTDPMPTQTTGEKLGLTIPSPFLVSYYSGSDQAKPVTDPVATVSTHDRHGLVQPGSEPAVEDCYFRMLKSHEIGKAMAFPDTYTVLGTERERVKQYGNAVTPPVMTMILERCIEVLK
jgi:DNA (cytosine-5)-methyltransferase 1